MSAKPSCKARSGSSTQRRARGGASATSTVSYSETKKLRDLGYKQPAIAITKHVRGRHVATLQEVLDKGVYDSYTPPNPNKNVLASRWITEPGLYQLVFRSHLACAERFQDFVFEKVLPSIRKTGSYSAQPTTSTAEPGNGWLEKRAEGKDLMRLKNASLQELIAGGFGQIGSDLYRIAGNNINQAVLGFNETTASYKKQHQLPDRISIPDILSMQGQVARCYAETCFQKFVSNNLERLRGLPKAELVREFGKHKLDIRQAFVSTGMGDLQKHTLSVTEAKKRKKANVVTHTRKQQRLLQPEQPRAIECAV